MRAGMRARVLLLLLTTAACDQETLTRQDVPPMIPVDERIPLDRPMGIDQPRERPITEDHAKPDDISTIDRAPEPEHEVRLPPVSRECDPNRPPFTSDDSWSNGPSLAWTGTELAL